MKSCYVTFFFVFFLSLCDLSSSTSFENMNVHFVDMTPSDSGVQNFLFRGGGLTTGLDHSIFNYSGMVRNIQQAGEEAGVKVPEDFLIIDICLLNLVSMEGGNHNEDRNNTITEFNFFHQNPDKGSFVFWESSGSFDNASNPTIPSDFFPFLLTNFESWMADKIPTRMSQMREMLYTNYSKPAVIYGHCDCGCDRTGELFGSYYMKWLNISWEETNKLNHRAANRAMDCFNWLAMQWYCLYLNYVEGRSLNCLQYEPCSKQKVDILGTRHGLVLP